MESLPLLPPSVELETRAVFRYLPRVHRALAEFNTFSKTIPNKQILLNTLQLQEAKDSSEIENIITTHDLLFQAQLNEQVSLDISTRDVLAYKKAITTGFRYLKEYGFISSNQVKEIQSIIVNDNAGFRSLPGTTLKNSSTNEIVYIPPQHKDEIECLMTNWVEYYNSESEDLDPLVKMALLHHQFESIHPFYDGNGRSGRILNVLYLVLQNLLDSPILYISRYINKHKHEYYRLLQAVRDNNEWEDWILYMLSAVEYSANEGTIMVKNIHNLMKFIKSRIKEINIKIYSQDLLNTLFIHPYTKAEYLMTVLKVSRPTANSYLKQLSNAGLLHPVKKGHSIYYVNQELVNILSSKKQM